MTDDPRRDRLSSDDERPHTAIPTDRESPVGAPVIRGDESITGSHARRAVQFDPDDPDSLALAAETVGQFATGPDTGDHLYMLRGAAACAALVRGEGSYKAAAERASTTLEDEDASDEDGDAADGDSEPDQTVSVSFIRKWARVHDLPRSVRRQVALGEIAPSAAKHVARVGGEARLLLAWAILDGDLTVRDVRTAASRINDGEPIERVLADYDVALGRLEVTLPAAAYRDLRRAASLEGVDPGTIVADALEEYLE
ncbi:DUF7119 family protein [Natronosalvus vescus]|uniref:DUF7119 family protein n=1 Tax=Natronosalvus vescus TaxID=2953881 RepID=UPI0020916C2A|nr:hypothetical protein [Natronosalvus vescus]